MNDFIKLNLSNFEWLACCIDWKDGYFGQGIVWRDWGFSRDGKF